MQDDAHILAKMLPPALRLKRQPPDGTGLAWVVAAAFVEPWPCKIIDAQRISVQVLRMYSAQGGTRDKANVLAAASRRHSPSVVVYIL